MKTIEQTALEVSLPIDRYKLGTVGVIELCTRFLAAWLAQQEPVAWAATSDEGKVEALGFNESRRFDTPLFLAPPPAVQQKPAGYALIINGARQGLYAFKQDAMEKGMEIGARFDLLPLYSAMPAQGEQE